MRNVANFYITSHDIAVWLLARHNDLWLCPEKKFIQQNVTSNAI